MGSALRRSTRSSHFVCHNWRWREGSRDGVEKVTGKVQKRRADLIRTAWFNPASKTDTCFGLAVDIDLDKTDLKFIRQGVCQWSLIGNLLKVEVPEIFGSISHVASSTSGSGLGLLIPISPLELIDTTRDVQIMALLLQSRLVTIFQSLGIGADPGALGLKRDMPNFTNPAKLIDQNEERMREVITRRIPVISDLLKATNSHSALQYRKKADDPTFLCTDSRREKGLAKVYLYLLDELPNVCQLTFSEIKSISGLSVPTLYKVLRRESPSWLKIKNLGPNEGYRLQIRPETSLTERAREVLTSKSGGPQRAFHLMTDFCEPSAVADGANDYLTSAIILLKRAGISAHVAGKVAASLGLQMPASKARKNCCEVEAKVRSIYRKGHEVWFDRSVLPVVLRRELMRFEKAGERSQSGIEKSFKKGEGRAPLPTLSSLGDVPTDLASSNDRAYGCELRAKPVQIFWLGARGKAESEPRSSKTGLESIETGASLDIHRNPDGDQPFRR
jgi:hypothetical protein